MTARRSARGRQRPRPGRKESEIVREILAYLRLVPGVVVRFGKPGLPDILGFVAVTIQATIQDVNAQIDGTTAGPRNKFTLRIPPRTVAQFLAIEVKRPGQKPTPAQAAFLAQAQQAGGIAFVATSLDDVRTALGADS